MARGSRWSSRPRSSRSSPRRTFPPPARREARAWASASRRRSSNATAGASRSRASPGGRPGSQSEPGVATTFAFELPEWGGAAAEPQPGSGPRILICEDDVDVANLLALMLEREGFAADVAVDAAAARRLVHVRRYAAMTVDLTLPGQDG